MEGLLRTLPTAASRSLKFKQGETRVEVLIDRERPSTSDRI